MEKLLRKAYTLEYKQEAARLVESGSAYRRRHAALGSPNRRLQIDQGASCGQAARHWPTRRAIAVLRLV